MVSRIQTTKALNAIVAPALSEKILVEDCRHLVLEAYLAAATSVFKVKVSNADDVDFSQPSTVANPWYYADLVGLGDGGTTTTGSTGVSTTAETSQKGYAINVDLARWIAVDVSALSAGSLSIILSRATNE